MHTYVIGSLLGMAIGLLTGYGLGVRDRKTRAAFPETPWVKEPRTGDKRGIRVVDIKDL